MTAPLGRPGPSASPGREMSDLGWTDSLSPPTVTLCQEFGGLAWPHDAPESWAGPPSLRPAASLGTHRGATGPWVTDASLGFSRPGPLGRCGGWGPGGGQAGPLLLRAGPPAPGAPEEKQGHCQGLGSARCPVAHFSNASTRRTLGAHTSQASWAHLLRKAATCQGTCPGNTLPRCCARLWDADPPSWAAGGSQPPASWPELPSRLEAPVQRPMWGQVDQTLSRTGPCTESHITELSASHVCWGDRTQRDGSLRPGTCPESAA